MSAHDIGNYRILPEYYEGNLNALFDELSCINQDSFIVILTNCCKAETQSEMEKYLERIIQVFQDVETLNGFFHMIHITL